MINQDAFLLAQAEKEDMNLDKYRDQIIKELNGTSFIFLYQCVHKRFF